MMLLRNSKALQNKKVYPVTSRLYALVNFKIRHGLLSVMATQSTLICSPKPWLNQLILSHPDYLCQQSGDSPHQKQSVLLVHISVFLVNLQWSKATMIPRAALLVLEMCYFLPVTWCGTPNTFFYWYVPCWADFVLEWCPTFAHLNH